MFQMKPATAGEGALVHMVMKEITLVLCAGHKIISCPTALFPSK